MSVIDLKNPLKMGVTIFLFVLGFLALVLPLDQILPPALHGFIPPILKDTTILLYLQLHFDLLVKLAGLGFVVYALWRIIKGR